MGSPVHPRTPHLRGTDTPARASHPTNASGRPRVTPSLHLSVRLTDGSDDSDASFVVYTDERTQRRVERQPLLVCWTASLRLEIIAHYYY